MKILALETSARSVSAAVTENGTVLVSAYQNRGLTHSVTLMPLIDGMLHAAGLSLDDIGLIAVTNGPGSFTGLRIGVSAAKGLAWAKELPCCGVSTLAAMARTAADFQGLIIGAMDARRQQIYHALFRGENGRVTRVTEDCAISLEELAAQLRDMPEDKLVVGDGAALCAGYLNDAGIPCRMAHGIVDLFEIVEIHETKRVIVIRIRQLLADGIKGRLEVADLREWVCLGF
mgnify:CR=1 FL=1